MQDSQESPYVPTLEDIAAATARIRETWSEATHRERAGLSTRAKWCPPLVVGVSQDAEFIDYKTPGHET